MIEHRCDDREKWIMGSGRRDIRKGLGHAATARRLSTLLPLASVADVLRWPAARDARRRSRLARSLSKISWETRFKVHQALAEHKDLIDAFADENPFDFDASELEIIRSWKHLVAGTFYAFRQLKNYMVFLSSTDPVVAYGVLALFDPLTP